MEQEVADAIKDLTKRMEYQESIHKDIGMTTKEGFLHGVISGLPILIASVAMSVVVAVIIVSAINNKKIKPV